MSPNRLSGAAVVPYPGSFVVSLAIVGLAAACSSAGPPGNPPPAGTYARCVSPNGHWIYAPPCNAVDPVGGFVVGPAAELDLRNEPLGCVASLAGTALTVTCPGGMVAPPIVWVANPDGTVTTDLEEVIMGEREPSLAVYRR
jgi:hypothetical protein